MPLGSMLVTGALAAAVGGATSSALGLCCIAERQPQCCKCKGKSALLGAGLLLLGIFLSAAAESLETQAAMTATLVAVILRSPVLLCWLCQNWLERRCAPLLHNAAIIATWLGVSLIEWGTPRPRSGLSAGVSGLWSGRNTGYRGPFLVYFTSWLLGLLVAWHAWYKDAKMGALPANLMRRVILALVCGASWPMADSACAVGLATLSARDHHSLKNCAYGILLTTFGLAVALLLLKCTWESLRSLQSPFCINVALVYGFAALTQVLQSHLLFHDLSWTPPGDALISFDSPSASTLALGCVIVMLALPVLLKLLTELAKSDKDFIALSDELSASDSATLEVLAADHASAAGFGVLPTSGSCRSFADTNFVHRMLNWFTMFLLILNLLGYLLGMMQPLIMLEIPGSDKKTVQQHTKSNLELISILYSERMPCAAITILICTVLIPCLKFGATILALAKPGYLSDATKRLIHTVLSMMSPYQFVDIFLVLLMLAYLNRSMHICKLMHGFSWFLMFCTTSVMLAQLVELEPFLFPANTPVGVPGSGEIAKVALPACNDLDAAAAARGLRKTLHTLFIFLGAWLLFWLTLIAMPFPPLMIQARVMGVVIFVQEPTVPELYSGLCRQSLAFAKFSLSVLIGIPLVHTAVSVLRVLQELKRIDPQAVGRVASHLIGLASARHFWLIEQLLKPWVMGDAAALALSGLFLSIQEPSKNFVLLLAQLPHVPMGFWAFLGMGVASCGLRVSPPELSEFSHVDSFEIKEKSSEAVAAPSDECPLLLQAGDVLDDTSGTSAGKVRDALVEDPVVSLVKASDECHRLSQHAEELRQEAKRVQDGKSKKSTKKIEEGLPTNKGLFMKEASSASPVEPNVSEEEVRVGVPAEDATRAISVPDGESDESKEEAIVARLAGSSVPTRAENSLVPSVDAAEIKVSDVLALQTSPTLAASIQQHVPWSFLVVWILWATLLWQFGPERPLTIHSLSELNEALHHILPDLNSEVHRVLPSTLGSCGKLKNSRGREAAKDTADQGAANFGLNCTDEQAVSVIELPGLLPMDHYKCRILWVDGLNTLMLREIALFPKEKALLSDSVHRNQKQPQSVPFTSRKAWVLRVSGHFSGLQVWASASQVRGKQAADHTDGYICCKNPYHFMFQVSAECAMNKQGFDGKFDVQALQMDPISLNLFVGGYLGPGSHEMLTVDLGKFTDTISSDIRGRVGHFLSRLSGDTPENNTELPSTSLPFKIVDVLNTIMQYNGWDECA